MTGSETSSEPFTENGPAKRFCSTGTWTPWTIDAAEWSHDLFGGEIEDGKIYGRGASDMKGSDCAMVMAAGRFAAQTKKDFAGTICVSGSVHEECFEGVAPREITKRIHPDFVIVAGDLHKRQDRPAGTRGGRGRNRGA